jgi:hypothetical protein
MLKERGDIKDAIALADKHKNYGDLMELLKRALKLNCEVMDALVRRFQELVRDEQAEIRDLLGQAIRRRSSFRGAGRIFLLTRLSTRYKSNNIVC